MKNGRAIGALELNSWRKVAWQKVGKKLPLSFFVNEHNNTSTKPQAKNDNFQNYPRRETAASGGKKCRCYKGSTLQIIHSVVLTIKFVFLKVLSQLF